MARGDVAELTSGFSSLRGGSGPPHGSAAFPHWGGGRWPGWPEFSPWAESWGRGSSSPRRVTAAASSPTRPRTHGPRPGPCRSLGTVNAHRARLRWPAGRQRRSVWLSGAVHLPEPACHRSSVGEETAPRPMGAAGPRHVTAACTAHGLEAPGLEPLPGAPRDPVLQPSACGSESRSGRPHIGTAGSQSQAAPRPHVATARGQLD